MPPPKLGEGRTFEAPPQGLMDRDKELYEYLFMLHARLFGVGSGTKGDLDLDNINEAIIPEVPPGHNRATHNTLVQSQAVEDIETPATATALSVDSVDASGLYGTPERDLINEIKDDLNVLFTEYNVAVTVINGIETKLNDVLASLRAANLMAAE